MDAMAQAFAGLSAGHVELPQRLALDGDGGVMLAMPARQVDQRRTSIKIVSVFPGNRARGIPVIHGLVMVMDDATGVPLALMDASYLTALRTGAASGLATRLLSDPNSRVLTVFGAGAQAPLQIEAVRAVRPIEEVRVLSRSGTSAVQLVDGLDEVEARVWTDPDAAVADADVIVTATDSVEPLFRGESLKPGAHLCCVGAYRPDMREVDFHTVLGARVVVDSREAAMAEAGDLIQAVEAGLADWDLISAEIGEVVSGTAPAVDSEGKWTVFKSVGTAVQDVGAAHLVFERAQVLGLGTEWSP